MNSTIKNFKSFIIESRFFSVTIIFLILGMRFLMYNRLGVEAYESKNIGFIWDYISPLFAGSLVSFVSSTICVFIIAIILSQINVWFGIVRGRSTLPISIPLIILSIHPFSLSISPDLFATIFILWALIPLFKSYQSNKAQIYAFQASVLLSIAGIFQIYSLIFIPFWWIGHTMMNSFSFKSFLSSLLGFILVYISVFSLYVFGDNIIGFLEPFNAFATFDFQIYWTLSVPQWGFITLIVLLIITHILFDIKHFYRDRVLTQKFISFSIVLIMISFIAQFVYIGQSILWIYIVLSLLSMIISHFYSTMNNKLGVYIFFIFLALLITFYFVKCFTDLAPF